MAVSSLAHEVSDLCIGKPALRSLPPSATVGQALLSLKRCGETYLSVWTHRLPLSGASSEKKSAAAAAATCVGKICMVDVICFLCSEPNLSSPASALQSPVSALLPKDSAGVVRRAQRHSSVLEALDLILDGAQNLVVPLRVGGGGRKKLHSNDLDFCWLTQEDFVRFFLNSIGLYSPIPALSVDSLGIIRPDVVAVRYYEPALSAAPLIRRALADQTAVAVVTDDGKLIGEISPSTLANCDETVAAAIATLTAGELMAYIDCGGGPPEKVVQAVKARLRERGLEGMLDLLEEDVTGPDASLFSVSSSGSSSSSSSDEESVSAAASSPRPARARRHISRSGSYSSRMGRRSEEAIVCHPGSSLVAVMIQALAHRVGYVWVVEEDYELAGVVTFPDVLRVFREQLES